MELSTNCGGERNAPAAEIREDKEASIQQVLCRTCKKEVEPMEEAEKGKAGENQDNMTWMSSSSLPSQQGYVSAV